MHICGMDFSSLASYWQIKALLMLEPSVVTPQNQYFPANSERMSVHCLESGCIGKYTHLGPRDFPRAGILHPSAHECEPRGIHFPIHPTTRQFTDTVQEPWSNIRISEFGFVTTNDSWRNNCLRRRRDDNLTTTTQCKHLSMMTQ